MKTPSLRAGLLALAVMAGALFSATASFAGTYTASVTNQTSLVIPESTHGLSCNVIGVQVFDSAGTLQPPSFTLGSVDVVTFQVSMVWASSFTGSVTLTGCIAETYNSWDFQVSAPQLNGVARTATIGALTTVDGPSNVTLSDGVSHIQTTPHNLILTTANCSGTVYVWLDNAGYYWGFSTAPGTTCATLSGGKGGSITYGMTGFPASTAGNLVTPLATIPVTNGSFGTVTDLRGWIGKQ